MRDNGSMAKNKEKELKDHQKELPMMVNSLKIKCMDKEDMK